MPRIAVIGTGYVGLVSGACFSEWGFQVICVDKDRSKIDRLCSGSVPIYEAGLKALVERNSAKGHLQFTTDLSDAVQQSDVVFIAVGTPMGENGDADLSAVYEVARAVAETASGRLVLLTKSTVPVGTTRDLMAKIRQWNPESQIEVASNPEFLREGSAISDFMNADRVIVGADSPYAREMLAEIYAPLTRKGVPLLMTNPPSAELIKYAANGFLATKVAFINEMATLCEELGANIDDVSGGMGLDKRIGKHFLQAGPGYGGSCFPKDTHALAATARRAGAPSRIVESVIDSNDQRKAMMANRIIEIMGGDVVGKTIGVLGLTFKANTDDMRDSASLVILPRLLEAGATIKAYDPAGMEQARPLLPDAIHYVDDAYAALDHADAAVILAEWDEFRSLNFAQVQSRMRVPVLIDLRNIFHLREFMHQAIHYYSIGRQPVDGHVSDRSKRHVA